MNGDRSGQKEVSQDGRTPDATFLRTCYDAFARGDMPTLTDMFAGDVVWHLPGVSQISGDHRGRDAVFAVFAKSAELSGGSLKLAVHDIVANGDHAVALIRESASRGDRRYDCLVVDVFHIGGGKITEFWSFVDDQRTFDAVWS